MFLTFYIAILAGWLALSTGNQFLKLSARLGRFDRLSLLPRWTFFAPNPGIDDLFLVYRTAPAGSDATAVRDHFDRSADVTPWSEVEHPALRGTTIWLLWHPQRRAWKAMTDMSRHVSPQLDTDLKAAADFDIGRMIATVSFGYLLFCELVEWLDRVDRDYQWALVSTHGFAGARTLRFVFLSDFHRQRIAA